MAYETTTELRSLLAQEVGDENPSSTELTRLLGLLDDAHKEIVGGGGVLNVDSAGNMMSRPHVFPWAVERNPMVITTDLPIETGTVSVTSGLTSATLSSAPSDSVANWYFRVGNEDTVYRVTAHTAATTGLTLDTAYLGTTAATATYALFKLDYDFSASEIMVPAGFARGYHSRDAIPLIGIEEHLDRYPLAELSEGDPDVFGVKHLSSGALTVRFNHYPTEKRRFELRYVKTPTALDTSSSNPIIPREDRKILVHLAAYHQLIYRDDARAQQHLATARAIFQRLKAKGGAFTEHQDKWFGFAPPFPGGFTRPRGSGFNHGDYET